MDQQQEQNEVEAAGAAATGQIAEPRTQATGQGDDPAAGEIMRRRASMPAKPT